MALGAARQRTTSWMSYHVQHIEWPTLGFSIHTLHPASEENRGRESNQAFRLTPDSSIPEPCRAKGNAAVVRTQHNLKPM